MTLSSITLTGETLTTKDIANALDRYLGEAVNIAAENGHVGVLLQFLRDHVLRANAIQRMLFNEPRGSNT